MEREDTSRLAWAFGISIAIHLLLLGTYETGKKFDLWNPARWPKWMQAPRMISELFKKPEKQAEVQPEEQVPLMFVEVNPLVATPDPPKNAPYYAARNSQAANPDPEDNTDIPKIDGRQKDVVKTEDVRMEEITKLSPAPPQPEPEPESQPVVEVKPQPEPIRAPGDLTMAKPQPEPPAEPKEAKPPRPRTIREALARKESANRIPGEKMKQDGGVKRRLEIAALDAKATPFGAYDQLLVEAISQRWFTLLEQREYASDARGRVVLRFVLHYNGRITDLEVAENSAGEVHALICQKAVRDPAPYASWPGDMRRMMGDTRKIQFTFFYQ